MNAREEIGRLRREIDRLDDEILARLEVRADIARQLGELKAGLGVDLRDPPREAEILERLCAAPHGLPPESITRIYREIIAACLRVQQR